MIRPAMQVALLALGLSACSSEPNLGEYATNEIEAVLKAQNKEQGNTVSFEVILLGPQSGMSPNYIKLTEEAALTATWGDNSATLEQVTQGVISYGADATVTEATEFNIAFTRPDGEDAPINLIYVAAPFEITSVSGSVASGGTVDVAWSGGSGTVDLMIAGDCIQQFNTAVTMSDGSTQVPFESLVPVDAANPTSCLLTTQLHSENEGAADPAWAQESSTVGRVLRSREAATTYQP